MATVIHRRNKCIGCNYCVEIAPEFWRMSRKDGKAVLLGADDKRGNWVLKISDAEIDINRRAADACPVKVIDVRE
ncbi:MAG: ferredoxin [Chitinophagales bacterium]|nr:ferredoxin [Chitinophagales bacterium]MCZ2394410.1 ferredoxin [Chitinophagales bacterium]